jgi:hypothetical protein
VSDGYVIMLWGTSGWTLQEREGEPPAAGERFEDAGKRLEVSKVGSSPLPGDRRRCVYTTAA